MSQHIGIVACSAPGAALCYRTVCAELRHPEVTMHGASFAAYVERLERGDWRGVGALILASATALARAGADFLICPDNTIHEALSRIEEQLPLPWLHIAAVVADEAAERGFRRVGIMGTKWLVDGEVYPEKLRARGIECDRPTAQERDRINSIIMDELVYEAFKPESVAYLLRTIENMKGAGCDAVALACTELPLVIDDANSLLPTLDSTRLLARAAVNRAKLDRHPSTGSG
jgi:aspartate racemase